MVVQCFGGGACSCNVMTWVSYFCLYSKRYSLLYITKLAYIMVSRTVQESTSLLHHHEQDDFRQFMDTEENESRHKLAKQTIFGEVGLK